MKKLFCFGVVALSLFGSQNACSQVRFGVKAGIQATNASPQDLQESRNYSALGEVYLFDSNVNPHILPQGGFFMEAPLSNRWSIQSSILWNPKGFNLQEVIGGGIAGVVIDTVRTSVRIQYVELPILVLFHFQLGQSATVRMGFGPYLTYGIKSRMTRQSRWIELWDGSEGLDFQLNSQFNPFDYGGKATIGLEVRKVLLELSYIGGISDLALFKSKTYNRALGVTVGYFF